MSAAWDEVVARAGRLASLRSALQLLEWDQQVTMPSKGAATRGETAALLARLHHEALTDPRLSDAVHAADVGHDPVRRAAVRELRRRIDRAVRVPADLVAEERRVTSDAFQAWLEAKAQSRFELLAPLLGRVVGIKREVAAAIDGSRHPYDVLLDEYEPTATLAGLRPMFARLEAGLRPLLDGAREASPAPTVPGTFPVARQRALHEEVIRAMGFDVDAGRLDFSEHPFSVGIAPGDTRITTHLYEDDLLQGLGGTLHEAGHGLYEQGLPRELPGTGVDEAASFGLHESQSRFWENLIGRSLPFCRWLAPRLAAHLGASLDPELLYRASNPIRPSLIRVAADEATYNLHIALRFELEVALVEDRLPLAELPAAWSDASERLLGLRPPDDRTGCLQDVHWPVGAIGYFPTYTLGNLWAASLGAALVADVPDVWARVEAGDLAPVLGWLRDRVHRHGHVHEAPELVAAAAGERDGVADLVDHLWSRHGALHGLTRPA